MISDNVTDVINFMDNTLPPTFIHKNNNQGSNRLLQRKQVRWKAGWQNRTGPSFTQWLTKIWSKPSEILNLSVVFKSQIPNSTLLFSLIPSALNDYHRLSQIWLSLSFSFGTEVDGIRMSLRPCLYWCVCIFAPCICAKTSKYGFQKVTARWWNQNCVPSIMAFEKSSNEYIMHDIDIDASWTCRKIASWEHCQWKFLKEQEKEDEAKLSWYLCRIEKERDADDNRGHPFQEEGIEWSPQYNLPWLL